MRGPAVGRLLFAVLAAVGLASGAAAAAPDALSPADRAEVACAETYLNALKSLRARFVQSSSNGDFARGTLYLRRPGRLRLDYDAPSRLQIYANGFWLALVDTELREISQIPVDRTPAGFLVRETISLSDGLRVTRVERGAGRVSIRLVQAEEPEAGSVILAFDRGPTRLRGWTVIDALGVRTEVVLVAPAFDAPIPREIFAFDPDMFSVEDHGG